MDDYLIDRETLAKLADDLIEQKALSADTSEKELNDLKEGTIKSLDEAIGLAVFGSLTESQNEEINRLLDDENTTEAGFRAFFDRSGLNFETIITNAIEKFSMEFLGGQNAI